MIVTMEFTISVIANLPLTQRVNSSDGSHNRGTGRLLYPIQVRTLGR